MRPTRGLWHGLTDCNDGCPLDAFKQAPGGCGCAVVDVDNDGDGTLDCQDMCPNDVLKLKPGVCGCGRPDTGDSKATVGQLEAVFGQCKKVEGVKGGILYNCAAGAALGLDLSGTTLQVRVKPR